MCDGQVDDDPSAGPVIVDEATFELLTRLISLPPPAARRVRDGTPRRRAHRPQQGPGVDLGTDA